MLAFTYYIPYVMYPMEYVICNIHIYIHYRIYKEQEMNDNLYIWYIIWTVYNSLIIEYISIYISIMWFNHKKNGIEYLLYRIYTHVLSYLILVCFCFISSHSVFPILSCLILPFFFFFLFLSPSLSCSHPSVSIFFVLFYLSSWSRS